MPYFPSDAPERPSQPKTADVGGELTLMRSRETGSVFWVATKSLPHVWFVLRDMKANFELNFWSEDRESPVVVKHATVKFLGEETPTLPKRVLASNVPWPVPKPLCRMRRRLFRGEGDAIPRPREARGRCAVFASEERFTGISCLREWLWKDPTFPSVVLLSDVEAWIMDANMQRNFLRITAKQGGRVAYHTNDAYVPGACLVILAPQFGCTSELLARAWGLTWTCLVVLAPTKHKVVADVFDVREE